MEFAWIDSAITVLTLIVVMTVAGRPGRGEGRTARNYFLASDRLPWYAVGASWVATGVSIE